MKTRHDVAADAELMRSLHVPGDPVLFANIWDPATAALVESAGVRAIATASAAIAPVNGYEDHGHLPPDVAFAALRRITDAVSLPVTADLENGYGLSADELVERLIGAGACGFNIEDTDHPAKTLVDINRQTDHIAAIKAAGRARGVDVVVNARTDVHILGLPLEQGLERARRYFEGGADCVYPILVPDLAILRQYTALGRINAICHPGSPTLAEFAKAGVARISVGPMLFRQLLDRLRVATESLLRMDDKSLWG